MPSWPKLLHKKRGERSSVSHVAGSMGEAILAAALVQMGAVLAVWLIADTIATLARSEPLAGIWFIVLAFLAATACIATGTWRLLKLMLQESTTAERRSAFVGQAMALQRKLRARQANRMPNIPEPKDFGTQRGRKLSYRLPNSGRDAYRVLYWGLASLLLSMVSSGVLAVTLNRWTWTLGSIALSIASIILLVLVGVSIWWFVKQLLAWFRCGPTGIELSQFPLIPGTKAEVWLSQSGRMRLRNLEVSLECVEIAVYQQGTDARREVTIVDEIPIHTEPRVDIAARRPWEKLCELEIPEDAMHSFIAASNAIQWRLAVRAKGVNCPSLSREAPIVVFPKPTSF